MNPLWQLRLKPAVLTNYEYEIELGAARLIEITLPLMTGYGRLAE